MLNVVASNFRGFRSIRFELDPVTFLMGDNSSGKTSLLGLIEILLSQKFANDFEIFDIVPSISDAQDIFSPYISSKTVTLGYNSRPALLKSPYDARLITFKAGGKTGLRIQDVAIARHNVLVNLERRKNHIYKAKIEGYEAVRKAVSRFARFESFGRRAKKVDVPLDIDSARAWRLACIDFDKRNQSIRSPTFLDSPLMRYVHYGPIRLPPQRYYLSLKMQFDASGAHAPSVLRSLMASKEKPSRAMLSKLNKFGRQSGLFERIIIESHKIGDKRSPFRIDVVRNGKRLNLTDVGYGNAQILPIVIDAIRNVGRGPVLLAIEQPETHLHPKAQAAFGELLFDLAEEGIFFLVETHSDFILDRFRLCRKNSKAKTKFASKILFCETQAKGNIVHSIKIDPDGVVENAPDCYREFFMAEQRRLFEML